MAGHGGKRPGAGRQFGALGKATIDKATAREAVRLVIMQHMEALLASQIQHAQGIKHMILRGKNGEFIRATDEKQIDAALALGENAYYLFTKDPSVQAFTDLLNRALDKPSEHVELTGANQGPLVMQWQE